MLAAAAERSAALEHGGAPAAAAKVGGLVRAALDATAKTEAETDDKKEGSAAADQLRDAWNNARRALGMSV